MRGKISCVILAAAWFAGTMAASAQEPAQTGATVITSTKLSFDYRNHYAAFEGNVVVRDPAVRIESDRMTVLFDADNSPKVVTATGNVRIVQGDRRAVCQRAVYQVRLGRLDLSGNPVVRRAKDLLKGKTITFWRNDDRMEGDEVELVIYSKGGGVDDFLKE